MNDSYYYYYCYYCNIVVILIYVIIVIIISITIAIIDNSYYCPGVRTHIAASRLQVRMQQ